MLHSVFPKNKDTLDITTVQLSPLVNLAIIYIFYSTTYIAILSIVPIVKCAFYHFPLPVQGPVLHLIVIIS